MNSQYSPPVSCGLSKKEVHAVAEQAAKLFEYTPGSELHPIVEKLGGEIRVVAGHELYETQDGSITIDDDGSFIINLANDVGYSRQRFTIAHELGHLVLHYVMAAKSEPLQANRYGTGRTEWEANWFASAFLMPEAEIKESYYRHSGNISNIAFDFDVSHAAAEIRLDELSIKG